MADDAPLILRDQVRFEADALTPDEFAERERALCDLEQNPTKRREHVRNLVAAGATEREGLAGAYLRTMGL